MDLARIVGIVILSGSLLAACASDVRRPAARDGRTRQALLAAGDADSVAAAAMLVGNVPDDAQRRFELLSRAVSLAPERPDLRWHQLQACERLAACDAAPLAQALRALDPDNAAASLTAIRAAMRQHDEAALQASLDAAAATDRLDLYWNQTIVRQSQALLQTGAYEPGQAVLAVTAGLSIPPFRTVMAACQPPALDDPRRLDACRRLANVMRHGDTYIVQMLGLKLALRTFPQHSPEWTAASVAVRVAQYRLHAQLPLTENSLRNRARTREYLAVLDTHRTEEEAWVAILADAHRQTLPPPDWVDPDPT